MEEGRGVVRGGGREEGRGGGEGGGRRGERVGERRGEGEMLIRKKAVSGVQKNIVWKFIKNCEIEIQF